MSAVSLTIAWNPHIPHCIFWVMIRDSLVSYEILEDREGRLSYSSSGYSSPKPSRRPASSRIKTQRIQVKCKQERVGLLVQPCANCIGVCCPALPVLATFLAEISQKTVRLGWKKLGLLSKKSTTTSTMNIDVRYEFWFLAFYYLSNNLSSK